MKFDDTIIAPATVPGTGAISLIRISGPDALSAVDSLVVFKKGTAAVSAGSRVKFGTILYSGEVLDEVLVCIYRAPHSYTGEDSCEIMCHASSYIVSTILELAFKAGCRMAHPGEFTQRSFVNGKMDLSQAEAVADVISSSDAASHRLAFNQLKGGISMALAELRSRLLEMTSLLELELDFSEEDVEFADRSKLLDILDDATEHIGRLASSFKLGNAVKNGVPVAIIGPANAGKSTLLNYILGEERAIVSDIPGTTRDTIEECFNIDGIKFRFVDTAGIRDTNETVEKIGIERSYDALRKAEIVLVVLDKNELIDKAGNIGRDGIEQSVLGFLSKVDFSSQMVYILLNKSENLTSNTFVIDINNIVSRIKVQGFDIDERQILPISAKTGIGVDKLLSSLSEYESKRINDASSGSSVTITNMRHFEVLNTAQSQLENIRTSILSGLSSELIAEDLRAALHTLGSITGEITTDDVLGEIFKKFCIGK